MKLDICKCTVSGEHSWLAVFMLSILEWAPFEYTPLPGTHVALLGLCMF